MMFDEYDVVKAKRDLTPEVPKGTRGTIVMVYDITAGDYEVEFVDGQGNHIALLTVNAVDIEGYSPSQK
ncbi:MAG: DUF4926 domain-containing protein [Alicyclobacillaceae bacterium]|nr:DUF4926 domain-containing protein [Alicyclobacillaceae bacterium]